VNAPAAIRLTIPRAGAGCPAATAAIWPLAMAFPSHATGSRAARPGGSEVLSRAVIAAVKRVP
jgi:hypothetical protein